MNLMNLYDKELELSDYERIEMYSQIIEELKNDKIFDIILFDVIASLRNFHNDLLTRPLGRELSRKNALEYLNLKFSHILTSPSELKINQNHIYNDSQNVHEFVQSTIKVAKALMSKYPVKYRRSLNLELFDKRKFKVFFDVIENATVNGIKACDIFASIYYYIINHEHKDEMIKRLIEEINESEGTCASGHVTRMINSLRGFQNDFCTNLDEYESIKAIMFHKINKEINACDLFSLDDFEFLINSGKLTFTKDLQTTLRILKDYSKTEWFVELDKNGIALFKQKKLL
ncbi:MAG: hypothetical protein ACRCZ0_04125 [Cetobacterium sp.]